jgi:hypothetical protein
VPETTKNALRKQHGQLNPFAIKAAIEQQLKLIFSQVSVTPNVRHLPGNPRKPPGQSRLNQLDFYNY